MLNQHWVGVSCFCWNVCVAVQGQNTVYAHFSSKHNYCFLALQGSGPATQQAQDIETMLF